MSLKCTLCKLEFSNDDQLNEHLIGKRHKKFESLRDERLNSAKRSIFVSNLNKHTFVKHLEEHFGQFGKLVKVVSDHQKNSYAIIEFEEEKSVEVALECKEHKVNGKNLKVTRREIKEFVSKVASTNDNKKEQVEKLKEEALIVNTNLAKCESFDEQVNKLIEHFQLNEEQLKKRQAICDNLNQVLRQFWTENEYKVCLFGSSANGLACYGSDADMTILFEKYKLDNEQKQQVLPKIVVKQLKQNSSDNQSNSDSNNSSGNNQNNNNSNEIVEDLEVDVDPADKSDPDETNHDLKECVKKFFNNKDYGEYLRFDVEIQIKIMARIVQRFVYDIKTLKTITNTKCPVVRFFNDCANVNCDLSLNNFLAYENSQLIKLYIDLEPSLRKMIYVLRYWFKQKNLYATSKFNSYTIIWLAIFYMQTKNIGYLPTVEHLSQLAGKPTLIHGWNVSFERNVEKVKMNKPDEYRENLRVNKNCLNDLLKGFFELYATYPFGSPGRDMYNVIVTRTSQLAQTVPELSKLSPYINVQDPFELSHNLAANVSKNTMERFVAECRASNELLSYGSLLRKSNSKCWGLILLTTKKALDLNLCKKLASQVEVNLPLDNNSQKDKVDFVLYLLQNCLLFEQLSNEQYLSQKRKRTKMLSQICNQVDSLGLNCSPKRLKISLQESIDVQQPSDENNNKGNSDDEEFKSEDKTSKLSSHIISARNSTWIGRRTVKRELVKSTPSDVKELELEKMTSQKLFAANGESAAAKAEIHFRLDFFGNESNGLKLKFSLLDDVHSVSELNNFATLVHFMDTFINYSHDKLYSQWSSCRN